MSLTAQLESVIRSYASADTSLERLQVWLDTHVQDTADSADLAAVELSDRVWILLGELGYGERTEESVRSELSQLLSVRAR